MTHHDTQMAHKHGGGHHHGPIRDAMANINYKIAIISGKGGVGKTSVAVNAALCLAARGLRTALVDVDLGLANVDVLLNVQARYTLWHVIDGLRTVDEICTPAPCSLCFVPGAAGLEQAANLSEFERQNLVTGLQRLEQRMDVVVLDCGAGISRNVTSFAQCADQVVVVTNSEPTALADAYAMIKVLHRGRYEGLLGVYVNMVENKRQAAATYQRLAGVAQKFLGTVPADLGYMLHDPCVELAVRRRRPFVLHAPDAHASACVTALADDIARRCPTASNGGFFRRVIGLFS